MRPRFIKRAHAAKVFEGKRVAVVGSGPGCLDNPPGFIDSFDVVVRVNNYKLTNQTGYKTDVHASFYGQSIKKTRQQLVKDGVKLCLCKCPNSQPIESSWHRKNRKMNGVDFRYIYQARSAFWFCDTYVPNDVDFLRKFEELNRHIPTTGFSAILDVLWMRAADVYLTGFDFFESGIHNVNERWRPGRKDDPIGHRPELEAAWLASNINAYSITLDSRLRKIINAL